MISIRPATLADADMLLRWRNDEQTQMWSRSTDQVSNEQHCTWLEQTLASPDRQLFIVESNESFRIQDTDPYGTYSYDIPSSIAIGTGRLDFLENKVELSLTVSPEHRGNGYGGQIVKALVEWATAHGYANLRAYVKLGNIASLKTFLLADFEPVDPHQFVIMQPKVKA